MPDSTYKSIIREIHNRWLDGSPFAIHEIVKATRVSTSSVTRILGDLVRYRLVARANRGFNGRHYRVTDTWPLVEKRALEAFELGKVMKA